MKFSSFFIDRPVFASVLSAFILITGAIALFKLPVSEYPEVVPPSVVVSAAYPGANPKVIAETVAAPLEQEIVGVENMLYMSSQATMDGSLALTVTFRIGTDIDRAQVQVQNRVAQALPRLPEDVRAIGVSTLKSTPAFLMVVHLTSPDSRYDSLYLRNYATLNVRDLLARIPGVGDVRVFGAGDYAMRVWLDPQKMAARDLTTGDVVSSIREQNVQVAAGQVGAPPAAGSDSSWRSMRRAVCRPRKNSATWWSRPATTARSCACATSRAWNWARPPTPCSPCSATRTRWPFPCTSRRVRTRSSSPTRSVPTWRRSRRASPRAWTTRSSTTRRSSFGSPSKPSCTRCWKPCCWWCWW
jgi:hypothetical protein